eukprot:GGOE01021326.1.p1 GENE.GGOE01021326.1~~GGOE01021326.1.p1  ORF type:complete len:370 (+),score=59.04 GGOE01021326.1:63-1172(+)
MKCPVSWVKVFRKKMSAKEADGCSAPPASRYEPEVPPTLQVAEGVVEEVSKSRGQRRPAPLTMTPSMDRRPQPVEVAGKSETNFAILSQLSENAGCHSNGSELEDEENGRNEGEPSSSRMASMADNYPSPSVEHSLAAFGSALKLIKEGLWIGDLGCMISREWQKQGIQAIVTIMPSLSEQVHEVATSSPGLKHFHYKLDDHIEYGDRDRHNLSTLFSESPHKNIFDVLEFMHHARCNGESVMVHCEQGKRRSATVMAAYLIWYLNLSRKDSIQLIQSKRRGATVPGIWRDELQFLAERRAKLDEALATQECKLDRLLSQPDLRKQLEIDLKARLKESRRPHSVEEDLPTPSTASPDCSPMSPPELSGF